MTTVVYKRAAATTPGKHGDRDWRVTIADVAPTHSETVFMLGMKLIAEDRYDQPWHLGRMMLWQYVEALLTAQSPAEVSNIANSCQLRVDLTTTRKDAA